MLRLVLAATLTANYGIYGPAFELCENAPAKPAPGKTERRVPDSEKYEIRQRDRNAPGSLVPLSQRSTRFAATTRRCRRMTRCMFHSIDNPNMICYSKTTRDLSERDPGRS